MILAIILVAGLTTAPPPDAKALEREAKKIEELLIAPCCWSQPVAVHYSAQADEVRAGIRRLLKEGKTRQQVLDAFVAEYGTRILADPPGRGLHWVPWAFLLLGGAATGMAIRHLHASRGAVAPLAARASTPVDAMYAERLEEELRDLD